MRNQGDISWCYAHTAADYLQFFNRIPVQISAADIAVNYNLRSWPRFLRWLRGTLIPDSGFRRSAISDISEVGYCPEEYFPSETWVKRIMTGKNAGKTFNIALGTAVKEIVELKKHIDAGFYLVPRDLPFVYEFKDVNHQQFYDAIFTQPSGNVLDELRSAACDAHRKSFPKFIPDMTMSFKSSDSFDQVHRLLNQHLALSIDYFYGVLENVDQYSHAFTELHTSLLMGQRYNSETQECQYLIKNSYGTDCSSYDHRNQCEGGFIWVGEAALSNAMTSIVYFKN